MASLRPYVGEAAFKDRDTFLSRILRVTDLKSFKGDGIVPHEINVFCFVYLESDTMAIAKPM